MFKPLEKMSADELSQYMKQHQDDDVQWQKAYSLFAIKSDWQEIPEGVTKEEEQQFISDFIAQTLN